VREHYVIVRKVGQILKAQCVKGVHTRIWLNEVIMMNVIDTVARLDSVTLTINILLGLKDEFGDKTINETITALRLHKVGMFKEVSKKYR
jgi:hypothetical protein